MLHKQELVNRKSIAPPVNDAKKSCSFKVRTFCKYTMQTST